MRKAIHCFVTGRVQGVFFRASTQEKARELGLTGWVKNLNDGRVELIACGEESQVEQLQQWLHQGPAHAQVSLVEAEDCTEQDFGDFDVV